MDQDYINRLVASAPHHRSWDGFPFGHSGQIELLNNRAEALELAMIVLEFYATAPYVDYVADWGEKAREALQVLTEMNL